MALNSKMILSTTDKFSSKTKLINTKIQPSKSLLDMCTNLQNLYTKANYNVYCPNCLNINEYSQMFCDYCSSKLNHHNKISVHYQYLHDCLYDKIITKRMNNEYLRYLKTYKF